MRLLIVYEHFENGKLYEDYDYWYSELLQGEKLITIFEKKGSSLLIPLFVCLELKYLFPEWKKNPLDTVDKMTEFFGLSKKEFCHLFVPTQQYISKYGGNRLPMDPTSGQVAKNIYFFLDWELEKTRARVMNKNKNNSSGPLT